MADLPIPFSRPMVAAIRAGRKSQTRRMLRADVPEPPAMDAIAPGRTARHPAPYLDAYCSEPQTAANPRGMSRTWCWWTRDDRVGECFKVPYAPGDRLWVREEHYRFGHWEPIDGARTRTGRQKWAFVADSDEVLFHAPATGMRLGRHHQDPGTPAWHKRLPRFMFRRHSRMTLTVTAVRVQRLHDIDEADAAAEGMQEPTLRDLGGELAQAAWSDRQVFSRLWNHLHGPGAWDTNPWVSATTFTVTLANIDSIPKAEA